MGRSHGIGLLPAETSYFPQAPVRNRRDWTDELIRKRMRIFTAIRLPDGEEDGLYGSITPVNIFRVVLNRYFWAGLKVHPDRAYFSGSEQPCRFRDVSEIVRYE